MSLVLRLAAVPEPRHVLESRLRALCREAGAPARAIAWLPSGLSLRRFARVTTEHPEHPTLVARIEVPEDPAGRPRGAPPEPPHEPIRALLERSGLPVPRRLGADPAGGIELLEDAGPTSLRDAAAEATPEGLAALYREACALVPPIQRVAPAAGVAAFERRLDGALLAYKADLVVRYALPARGRPATPAEAAAVREAFAGIAREAEAPVRLAHRDLQSTNILVRHAAPGARLVLIDLQGAFLAPPEYDLVCLLRDSYVELSEPLVEELAEATRRALPDAPAPDAFARRFDLLTLARKGKDLARFLYAARERGDTRYLPQVPATVRALRRAAARTAAREPRLRALADLMHELPEHPPCAG